MFVIVACYVLVVVSIMSLFTSTGLMSLLIEFSYLPNGTHSLVVNPSVLKRTIMYMANVINLVAIYFEPRNSLPELYLEISFLKHWLFKACQNRTLFSACNSLIPALQMSCFRLILVSMKSWFTTTVTTTGSMQLFIKMSSSKSSSAK